MKRGVVLLLATITVGACQDGGPTSLDMVPSDVAASLSPSAVNLVVNAGEPLVIAGFDASRGGAFSLEGGSFVTDAIASLNVHGDVTFTTFPTLTAAAVVNADIMVIFSAISNMVHIPRLDLSEQGVLFDFVAGGGCAILAPDNNTFGGPTTDIANNSLIAPFGIVIAGTEPDIVDAVVTDPTASAVTNGPFGTVISFRQLFPGAFTQLGLWARSLATNPLGDALAVIERNALTPGSGPVVVFSDISTFADEGEGGFFGENEALWLNSIEFCTPPPPPPTTTPTPKELLDDLTEDVEALVDAGALNDGNETALLATLANIRKSVTNEKPNAVKLLEAFINKVSGFINGGILTLEEGQPLIHAAQAIIDALQNA